MQKISCVSIPNPSDGEKMKKRFLCDALQVLNPPAVFFWKGGFSMWNLIKKVFKSEAVVNALSALLGAIAGVFAAGCSLLGSGVGMTVH